MKVVKQQTKDIPGVELAQEIGVLPYQISYAKYNQRKKLIQGVHWYYAPRKSYGSQIWVMWTPAGQSFMKDFFKRKAEWHCKHNEKLSRLNS